MPIYPYSFQLPPLNVQDIPNNGAVGEFLGISAGGVLDWLPVASGGGDMLKSENLSGLASYPTARTNLGLGTTSTPTFKNLVISTGSIATSAPVTISQTWAAVGQTFKALVVDAAGSSGTNSASGSLLADFQVNGSSLVGINKNGQVIGSTSTVLLNLNSDTYIRNGNAGRAASLWAAECRVVGGPLVFSDSVNVNASDISLGVALHKESANTLALRNSTAAQTFNIYNTYQNAGVDYERIAFKWGSNLFTIGREFGGTGGARSIRIIGGNSVIGFGETPSAAVSWTFSSNHLLAGSDNQFDIGASGANRPRNVYVGSNVISRPAALITPANNSELVVEATSNTTLTFKLKGTDGTVRSGILVLA